MRAQEACERIPFRLVLSKDLALCVVANVADLDEASDIELGGAELRHNGGSGLGMGDELAVRCRG